MPNRLLRDGICTSDAVNSLSPHEEVLFYRLLVVADDFGYMDARPAILKAQCFPLRDTATPPLIEKWLCGLAGAGLIVRYQSAEGKPYLAVCKWEQRVRSRAKYPAPDGCQTIVSQPLDESPSGDGVGLGKGLGKGKGKARRSQSELHPLPEGWRPSEKTAQAMIAEFSMKAGEIDRYISGFQDACKAKAYRYDDFEAAFRNCVRQDWPKVRSGKPNGSSYGDGWWSTDASIVAKARELGLDTIGCTTPVLKAKIQAKLGATQ